MKKLRTKRNMDAFLWTIFILTTIWIISLIFLLGFGLMNSFKDWYEFEDPTGKFVFSFPSEITLDNYINIWNKFRVQIKLEGQAPKYIYIETMLLNSLVYSVVTTLVVISTQIVVAYAVSKYNFKFGNVIYVVAIVVMLVPIVGALPSQMKLMHSLNLDNSVIGVAIMQAKFPGMYFLIFYAMFKGVSWTYAESAQIDGAGHWRIFLQIMLPLVSSTIFGVFILQFIAHWNEYYTPMLFLPAKPTIAYGLYLYQFSPDNGMHTTYHLAASLITCLPVLVIFIIFRNKIMGNLSVGGIKG